MLSLHDISHMNNLGVCVTTFPDHESMKQAFEHKFSSMWRTQVSAQLAQLVRASAQWLGGPEFNSWVGHIFHLPVTQFGAVRVTSWVACGLSSYEEEPGIYLPVFWFSRLFPRLETSGKGGV